MVTAAEIEKGVPGSSSSKEHITQTTHRSDPPHSADRRPAGPASVGESIAPAVDSVLAQYQRAMAEGTMPRVAAPQLRPSRRELAAKAAEHPFVRRAIELFDAPPDKLRYIPPGERSSGAEQ